MVFFEHVGMIPNLQDGYVSSETEVQAVKIRGFTLKSWLPKLPWFSMCALPQNQHLEFNSVPIVWLETTKLAYWALPINWWKQPAFTQSDLCVGYLLYLHFTSYDPPANKYRYWRNDGRIKGTLSTNGGFSFIYNIIYVCIYIYIYVCIISIFIPTDAEFSRSPTPASPRAPSSSVPDSKMSIRALVVMVAASPSHTWRYLEIFRQFWWLGIWIPGYHLVN